MAREIADLTNENLSTVVAQALREKSQRLRGAQGREARLEKMREIAARSARKCGKDHRSHEAIIGYDEPLNRWIEAGQTLKRGDWLRRVREELARGGVPSSPG